MSPQECEENYATLVTLNSNILRNGTKWEVILA